MRRIVWPAVVLMIGAMIGISVASESSVDNYIKDLKHENPEIRAKAAYELGCG